MSRINRVPEGLQDLLGSQNFGDNPSELSRVVAPALEMMPFYYAQKREYEVVGPVSVTTQAGGPGFITVPEGEIWFVRAVGMRIRPDAGSNVFAGELSCDLVDYRAFDGTPPTGNIGFAHIGRYQTQAATAATTVFTDYVKELEFEPVFGGERLEFIVSLSNLTVADSMEMYGYVRFLRMKI